MPHRASPFTQPPNVDDGCGWRGANFTTANTCDGCPTACGSCWLVSSSNLRLSTAVTSPPPRSTPTGKSGGRCALPVT